MTAPTLTRQQKRAGERNRAKYGKDNMQTALNHLLWKIVMQNGGSLNVPLEELKSVPEDAALQGTVDSTTDRFIVIAGTRPSKNGIWTPGDI